VKSHTHFPALPVEGAAASLVHVEFWEDLACRDCALWRRRLDQRLLPRYGDRVSFVSRDFPLAKHPWAEAAAMASRRFASWDSAAGVGFRRYCLQNIAAISVENLPERVAEFAAAHGFDVEAAEMALRSDDLREAVSRDAMAGRQRGVEKTPTVFVGETMLVETFPLQSFRRVLDRALKRAVGVTSQGGE
jgi:predicted DsbA family dithiol-disulfide isomerase